MTAEMASALTEEGLDPNDPYVIGVVSAVGTISHHGPIPPASILEEYERLRPGTAGQIIGWADSQIHHRIEREKYQSEKAEVRLDRSQHYALATAIFGLILAALVGTFGQNTVLACVIAIVAVGGPTTASILARFIKPPTA